MDGGGGAVASMEESETIARCKATSERQTGTQNGSRLDGRTDEEVNKKAGNTVAEKNANRGMLLPTFSVHKLKPKVVHTRNTLFCDANNDVQQYQNQWMVSQEGG